jgi:hypothetical protein
MLSASIVQLGKAKKKRYLILIYQICPPGLSKSFMRLWGTWAQDAQPALCTAFTISAIS